MRKTHVQPSNQNHHYKFSIVKFWNIQKKKLVSLFDYNKYTQKNEKKKRLENIKLHIQQISGKLRNQQRELNTQVNSLEWKKKKREKSLGVLCTQKFSVI